MTYEAAEDSIARFDIDFSAIIVDGSRNGSLAIRAERTVQADALHAIVKDLVICFRRIFQCESTYFR